MTQIIETHLYIIALIYNGDWMRFIDREREMATLEREWGNRPSFVVLYGRRRVGKTRLLREFSKGKNLRNSSRMQP